MADEPVLHLYHPADRAEVFDLLRASLPADTSARAIAQWSWKYEANPNETPDGLNTHVIRLGGKIVGLSASFRLKMWMGGIECFAESFGDWVVHPDQRGQKLWRRVGRPQGSDAAVLIGWGRSFSPAFVARRKWAVERFTPLIRILDPGPLVEHFTHSPLLGSIGAAAWVAGAPLRRRSASRGSARTRLDAFDDRADALWERARGTAQAMVVRDRQYLNWRYRERPDATYTLFGAERESKLDGFLVARTGTHLGMRWGYLVDFLAAEAGSDVLSSLIDTTLDEFRSLRIAAVSCYATDPAIRRTLFRHGFFPTPQRDPIHFGCHIRAKRTDLQNFATLRRWYVTMGDSDLDMSF